MRSPDPRFLTILAVATLLGVFSSLLAYSFQLTTQEANWWLLFTLNISYWYAWAALAPPIFRLSRRFRLDRQSWRKALAVHFAAAALTTLRARDGVGLRAEPPARLADVGVLVHRGAPHLLDIGGLGDDDLLRRSSASSHALHFQRWRGSASCTAARLETSLAEARLQALQRQLHPHFLFNTLHGISALMHLDVDAADRMIALLGDLLRARCNSPRRRSR